MKNRKVKRFTITLNEDFNEELKELAREMKISKNSLIINLLWETAMIKKRRKKEEKDDKEKGE